jgi:hypothetical protein
VAARGDGGAFLDKYCFNRALPSPLHVVSTGGHIYTEVHIQCIGKCIWSMLYACYNCISNDRCCYTVCLQAAGAGRAAYVDALLCIFEKRALTARGRGRRRQLAGYVNAREPGRKQTALHAACAAG